MAPIKEARVVEVVRGASQQRQDVMVVDQDGQHVMARLEPVMVLQMQAKPQQTPAEARQAKLTIDSWLQACKVGILIGYCLAVMTLGTFLLVIAILAGKH